MAFGDRSDVAGFGNAGGIAAEAAIVQTPTRMRAPRRKTCPRRGFERTAHITKRYGLSSDFPSIFCCLGKAVTTEPASSRANGVTLSCDGATSEAGLGPAWVKPSRRINNTSENGEAAARSSKVWSFGCRPSPRDVAKTLN